MDDARAVGLVERVADLNRVAQGVRPAAAAARQALGERLAFEILEHEKTNRVISGSRWGSELRRRHRARRCAGD